MNETVTIKEGGLTRRLAPIDKLKVNTTDNKDSMWVPTGKENTGVLHASENGIYIASEDGYEAYSEVIVRVTKDSFEGDTSFDDWDYETPDMDLSNWDPETIEDFELDPDGFDDVFNNEDEWKDIDKPIDIKMDNPKIQDTKISGIDPVTGNEMEVGLDEDGYLTESTLPSSIKIVVPPDKHQYVEGQPILFRGMIVKAYTADGELWTDESHPDGIIPHSELTFPVTTAFAESGDYTVPDDNPYDVPSFTFGRSVSGVRYTGASLSVSCNLSCVLVCSDTGSIDHDTWIASKRPVNASDFTSSGNTSTTFDQLRYGGDYTIDNKTAYYGHVENENGMGTAYTSQTLVPTLNIKLNKSIWVALYGDYDKSGTQTVPVQYIRSDGEVLEDSFTIEVLADPDGAHPQVDPSTVEWNHRKYKANEDLGAVEVRHGSVYMEGGAIYDVGAAVMLGMLEPVDNEIVP